LPLSAALVMLLHLLVGAALFVAVLTGLGLGNTVGYHRLLTHRSFQASPVVRYGFAGLAALYSGPPLEWVGLHRLHHMLTEREGDPHSPNQGFWYAHCGWFVRSANPIVSVLFAASGFGFQLVVFAADLRRLWGWCPPWRAMVRDLEKEPVLRALNAPLVTPLLFVGQLAAASWLGGSTGLLLLWLVHLGLTNASWAVNSVCHAPPVGRTDFATRDQSRNVPWLAWLTNGESYHNNHHRFPTSAKHALHGGTDLSWWTILALVKLGLASDPKLPQPTAVAASRADRPGCTAKAPSAGGGAHLRIDR
jgi:stearoyl-CoA desaturase (Delta-9 desaturase)